MVVGSRRIAHYDVVKQALDNSPFEITVLLSGAAAGVDILAEAWALTQGIPIEKFPLDWTADRKSAPLIRNCKMARTADACVAIWDGYSRGTWKMVEVAARYRVNLRVHIVDD
jgi:hypothetical protein